MMPISRIRHQPSTSNGTTETSNGTTEISVLPKKASSTDNPIIIATQKLNTGLNLKTIQGKRKQAENNFQAVHEIFEPCIKNSMSYLNLKETNNKNYEPEIPNLESHINQLNQLLKHLENSKIYDKPTQEQAIQWYNFLEVKDCFLNRLNLAFFEEYTTVKPVNNGEEDTEINLIHTNMLKSPEILIQKYETYLQLSKLLPLCSTENLKVNRDQLNQKLFLTMHSLLKIQAEIIASQLLTVLININDEKIEALDKSDYERLVKTSIILLLLREAFRFSTDKYCELEHSKKFNPERLINKIAKSFLLFPKKYLHVTEALTLAFTQASLENISNVFNKNINIDEFTKNLFTFLRVSEHFLSLSQNIKSFDPHSEGLSTKTIDQKFDAHLKENLFNEENLGIQLLLRLECSYLIDNNSAPQSETEQNLTEQTCIISAINTLNLNETADTELQSLSENTSPKKVNSEIPNQLKNNPFDMVEFYNRHHGIYSPDSVLQCVDTALKKAQSIIKLINKKIQENNSDQVTEKLTILKQKLQEKSDWAQQTFTKLKLSKNWIYPDQTCLNYLMEERAIEYIRLTNSGPIKFTSKNNSTDYMYEFEIQAKSDHKDAPPQPFYVHVHLNNALTNPKEPKELRTLKDEIIQAAHIKPYKDRYKGKDWQDSQLAKGIQNVSIMRKSINGEMVRKLAALADVSCEKKPNTKQKRRNRNLVKK